MNKMKDYIMLLNDIESELFAIEQDSRVVNALQADIMSGVFRECGGENGCDFMDNKVQLALTARSKVWFAEALDTYINKVIDDISILRERILHYAKGGVPV